VTACLRVGMQAPRLFANLAVALAAGLVKQAANIIVGHTVHGACFADDAFAAATCNLLQQPLKILVRLVSGGQCVNRVFQGHGTEGLQTAPDFDPHLGWFGRQLMDQQGHRSVAAATSFIVYNPYH